MKINKLLLSGLIAAVIASGSAFAEKISKIEYEGCERVESETISSYLPVQVGDEYDSDVINEALKALHSTGFFEKVDMDMHGSVLVVKVKEYPIINKISFEGNSKISDKDIYKEIRLKTREVLSPAKIKEIQQGLLGAYRKMGRYNASVVPKIIKLENNSVNLVFEIDEGNAAGIGKVLFVGNENYSSSELREIISSKVKRWYRFFVTDDVYDQERMNQDKMIMTKFYHEHGYANAKVISGVAELSSDKKEFVLTYTIDEGEIYKLGDIKVKSHIKKITDKELSDDFYCKKGDIYNENLLEVDLANITRKAGRKGFSAVKVTPELVKDDKTKAINITYNVTEGDKVYISKIIIKGNTRTRDHIIRREIPVEEGDSYNQVLVSMAENNLNNLGYFKSVSIEPIQDPNAPDKYVLQVTVEETSTGEAAINGSYSTLNGIGMELSYNERNFMGTGKSLGVSLGSSRTRTGKSYQVDTKTGKETKISRKSKFQFLNSASVTVGDPHLFDKDIEGSVSFYRYQSGNWDCFSTTELGTGFGISYDLTPKFSQNWDYKLSGRKFEDVEFRSSPIIKYQTLKVDGPRIADGPLKGEPTRTQKSSISSLKHTISYKMPFYTGLKGFFRTGLSTTFSGLGGNAKFMKNDLFGVYTMPVSRKSVLKVALSYGLMNNIGGTPPNIIDSFNMGLDTFRGFDDCGLGPRSETYRTYLNPVIVDGKQKLVETNRVNKDFIGAKKYWKGTVELTFPIGLPEELQFRGFAFSDFGTLWDAPQQGKSFLKPTGKNTDEFIDVGGKPTTIPAVEEIPWDPTVKGHKILDSQKMRASIGFGISFVTPMGPMKFTYAMPVRKEKYDEPFRFLIGFATTF